jgi:outer membrane protein assembly factor BamB
MFHRSPLLAALLASAALAAPLSASDRLFVAGNDGFVMKADTDDGVFEYFTCACTGPIRALAADRHHLYIGDEFGRLLVADVETGVPLNLFQASSLPIDALAAADGSIFVGSSDTTVSRFDAAGTLLGARKAPAGVRSLVAHAGFLYVGADDGAIYRAPVASGEFEYFTCFCLFQIQDIVVVGGDLAIVDSFGTVARVSTETGAILTAFSVGETNSMARLRNTLLFYYSSGEIPQVDAETGFPLPGGFESPIDVQVMLVIPDRTPKHGQMTVDRCSRGTAEAP